MSSRFAEFLSNEKIDPRRLVVASRQLERLRPEDRQIRLKKRRGKGAEAGGGDAAAKSSEKPRSGRVLTLRILEQAKSGATLSGPQKSRIVRALNHVLQQKQREPVDLRKIF